MSPLEAELNDLSWRDLQARCRDLGLLATGKKTELIQRILEHHSSLVPAPTAAPARASISSPRKEALPVKKTIAKPTLTNTTVSVSGGIPNPSLSEAERRLLRAQRFGQQVTTTSPPVRAAAPAAPAALSAEEEVKRQARAARFGLSK
jgi:hypothetical protein